MNNALQALTETEAAVTEFIAAVDSHINALRAEVQRLREEIASGDTSAQPIFDQIERRLQALSSILYSAKGRL